MSSNGGKGAYFQENRKNLDVNVDDPLPVITLGDEINLYTLGIDTADSSVFHEIIKNDKWEGNESTTVEKAERETLGSLAAAYEILARTVSGKSLECAQTFYACSHCEKTFPEKRLLNRHLGGKHSSKFSCPHCKKSFTRKETKLLHIPKCKVVNPRPIKEKPSNQNNYYCNECCKSFTRKENYSAHMWNHQGIRFSCPLCEKQCTTLKSFMIHRQLHGDTRNTYNCVHCSYPFKYKSNLRRHIKGCEKVKHVIICKNCNLNVKSQKILEEHGCNPIKRCILCSQTFCLNLDLRNHRRVFHPDLWFKCKLCSTNSLFMTHSEGFLRRHAKNSHNVTLSFTNCYDDGWSINSNNVNISSSENMR